MNAYDKELSDNKRLFNDEVKTIVDSFAWMIDSKSGNLRFCRDNYNELAEALDSISYANSEYNQDLDDEELWSKIWEAMPCH